MSSIESLQLVILELIVSEHEEYADVVAERDESEESEDSSVIGPVKLSSMFSSYSSSIAVNVCSRRQCFLFGFENWFIEL